MRRKAPWFAASQPIRSSPDRVPPAMGRQVHEAAPLPVSRAHDATREERKTPPASVSGFLLHRSALHRSPPPAGGRRVHESATLPVSRAHDATREERKTPPASLSGFLRNRTALRSQLRPAGGRRVTKALPPNRRRTDRPRPELRGRRSLAAEAARTASEVCGRAVVGRSQLVPRATPRA